jgi:hypothetical protein
MDYYKRPDVKKGLKDLKAEGNRGNAAIDKSSKPMQINNRPVAHGPIGKHWQGK